MASDNPNNFTAQELGLPFPTPLPTKPDGQPRGNAMFPTAHPAHFSGLFSASNRSYYQWFDEALRYGRENANRMLNDPVIQSSLRLRITPTALLTNHTEPDDDTDEDEVKAAKNFDRFLKKFRGYRAMRRWLLWNGVWKGRSAAYTRWEKVFDRREQKVFENVVGMLPIDGDKLAFHWDGRVGLAVGSGFQGPTDSAAGFGRVYYLTPEERDQTVLFEYEPEDADFFEPEKAGLIHGAGLRHRLYWLWALKARLWSASIDFLEWWARGILIYYFEHGNTAHLQSVTQYIEEFDGQWQRIFPRMKDGGPGYKPIERIEPNVSTNTFLQDLITNYLDDLIRQIIIGQTLTTKTAATGMGSGVAEAHQDTFAQVIKYDANFYDECETYNLAKPWYATNYPGMPHGTMRSEVDSPNVQQLMDAAEVIYGMGGNVPEEPLLEAAGLPETKEGDTILTQVQPMQPAAVDGLPQGVPQVNAQPVGGDQSGGSGPVKMSRARWSRIVNAAQKNPIVLKYARRVLPRLQLHR